MLKKFSVLLTSMVMLINLLPMQFVSAETSINIGDYVEMGTYYGKPILWRCVDIDENGPLMLSDRILCIKAFDANGTNTTGSHGRGNDSGYYRKQSGSNYWADSNIRCWLNSKESAGNVTWVCGNQPDSSHMLYGYNAYNNEAGFLTNFSNLELACIKTVTQDSLLDQYEYSNMSPYGSTYHEYNNSISDVVQNAKTTAYKESATDSMFLLDVNQINKVYQNDRLLGDNNYYIGIPTVEAVKNSEYKNASLTSTAKWWSWLRSPNAYYDTHGVRYVHSDGCVCYNLAYTDDGGVRPAFYLNLSSFNPKGGSGTVDKPYTLYENAIDINALTFTSSMASVTITDNKAASGQIMLGYYDENDRLLGCDTKAFDLKARESETLEADASAYENISYIKAFVWDSANKPFCKSKKFVAE